MKSLHPDSSGQGSSVTKPIPIRLTKMAPQHESWWIGKTTERVGEMLRHWRLMAVRCERYADHLEEAKRLKTKPWPARLFFSRDSTEEAIRSLAKLNPKRLRQHAEGTRRLLATHEAEIKALAIGLN